MKSSSLTLLSVCIVLIIAGIKKELKRKTEKSEPFSSLNYALSQTQLGHIFLKVIVFYSKERKEGRKDLRQRSSMNCYASLIYKVTWVFYCKLIWFNGIGQCYFKCFLPDYKSWGNKNFWLLDIISVPKILMSALLYKYIIGLIVII